ncbi:uncharacterized protein LOC131018991 [Salvia miltiorrhiza]|uniref:uncharacterized protein LOC131018991 n=1 Tax=Salvia miltiorrhiza TaxID=226208 RepID=UPI0025ACF733|nr:uncharacterized protein LOC131018991 [Salvia miltiorrhiza]
MGKVRHTPWNILLDEEAGDRNQRQEEPVPKDDLRNRSGGFRSSEETSSQSLDPKQIEEILQLHNADHPGMQLVSAQLTGAESKLELLDGTLREPDFASPYYKAWIKADYMVFSWIINSISKELVNAFVHIENTKKLWDAICQRFGRSNGPKIYRLQREISGYTQGNQSVLVYFNNLTALWDELNMLLPPLTCVCGTREAGVNREENQRLMQFLLGLNESFGSARSQILFLDPLPSVNRAYSMVLQIEDQKITVESFGDAHVMQAVAGGKQSSSKGKKSFGFSRQSQLPYKGRKSKDERLKLFCNHCERNGHEESECFKLHGFPDWYKRLCCL